MFTSTEAKTKWCPFYRSSVAGGIEAFEDNRPRYGEKDDPGPGKIGELACCLGEHCMAWRWEEAGPSAELEDDIRGYCGLAGSQR